MASSRVTVTPCDVSKYMAENKSSCHSTSYCKEPGITFLSDMSPEDRVMLMHRIGIEPDMGVNPSTICHHHKMTLLDYFETLERTCCDPLDIHKKPIKASLRPIEMDMALHLRTLSHKSIKAGQKLCPTCRKKFHPQRGKLNNDHFSINHFMNIESALTFCINFDKSLFSSSDIILIQDLTNKITKKNCVVIMVILKKTLPCKHVC